MAEKSMDFGTYNDVNTTMKITDDTLGPNASCECLVEVKAVGATHTVDTFVILLPLDPNLSIDPEGPYLAYKLGETLNAGEMKTARFHIKNGPGGTNPAVYTLLCIRFVDGAFSHVDVCPV